MTALAGLRVGPLAPGHRARVDEILRATGVFREEEIAVALELFDEALSIRASGPPPPEGEGTAESAAGRHPRVASAPESSPAGGEHPDYRFLGAFAPDRTLVGYACYGPTPATDRTHDLYWIAVHPDAQGSGAGTRLLAEVERRLRLRGARLLVVETSGRDEYAATRGFYAAREYAESARVRDFYAPGDDRIIFTKWLSPRVRPAGRGAAQR